MAYFRVANNYPQLQNKLTKLNPYILIFKQKIALKLIRAKFFLFFNYEIIHSVVSSIPPTEAAFSKATLVTLVGSIIPVSNRFS